MKLVSLLYVSRSTLSAASAVAVVEQIVAGSRARNPGLGITGALLFTGEHFAQVLEGPAAAVDTLMASVTRDPRHEEITVAARTPIAERQFGRWSMAYSGPSQFVARHVTRLLDDPDAASPARQRCAEWLGDLLWEFAEGPGAG